MRARTTPATAASRRGPPDAYSLADLKERYVSATRAAFVSPSRGDDDDGDLPF